MARTKDFDENEVLCKAIQIFWHKGYNGTSMQDLVDGLGISRSSLYDTYTDKHTLFVKALESYQDTGAGKIQEIINNSGSAKATIKQLLEFVINELLGDKQQKGCFMVNAEVEVAPHDAEINDLVCKNDQQMEDAFYLVIKKGQDSGEIKKDQDARALSRFIFNTVKGIRVTAKSTSDRTVFDDIIKLTVLALD
ncbi:TetR/AcrR family transcriptional regulator [Mucilaginibacter sp. E4BP6]|uniref:TetR/AcrR family transcriptional regulator n=1 Tax=Mucilaginibacter sp. E4BP6 TaxID=2723089 RepID=UPI0015C95EBC|nr:TetR/AcrR family transcriptional regulator [Mucilaginibacter sp. E4BP6]NYE66413.1 TetR/AcrR family transcriptional repressor of nem operon [Mucilaginibacter sp. E4BP6]